MECFGVTSRRHVPVLFEVLCVTFFLLGPMASISDESLTCCPTGRIQLDPQVTIGNPDP